MNLKELIQQYGFMLILFALSTSYFFYQHATHFSWDFSAQVLNAKYWFASGNYFEILRPPATPFLLGILSIFGWKAAEYLFLLLASILFLLSSITFSKATGINKNLFYMVSLSPYLLVYSFLGGTELLALAFFEFFLAFLFQNKLSGHFLGLTCLTRYNFFLFIPFLLFARPKKILLNLGLFGLVLAPWLMYNAAATGNALTSFADLYAVNVRFRQDAIQPFPTQAFLFSFSILLPLALGGIFYAGYGLKKRTLKGILKQDYLSLLMFLVFLMSFYYFWNLPTKDTRYLFPLALPFAYFSALSFIYLKGRFPKIFPFIMIVFLFLQVFLLFRIHSTYPYDSQGKYTSALHFLRDKNLSNCRIYSDAWPLLNYLGQTTEPLPWEEILLKRLEQGDSAVLFYTPLESIQPYLLHMDQEFTVFGGIGCNPPREVTKSYLQHLQETLFLVDHYTINIDPCFILFKGSFLERGCHFVHLKGFVLDEHRETWKD